LKKTGFVATVLLLTILCARASAADVKVLFFEAAIPPASSTFSDEPTGFSKLADSLREDGVLVASMSSGVISRRKLSPYEIVVVHASPERPFEKQEISAFVWYVVNHGGALFVHGGDAEIINPLAEVFGVSMDESNLLDASSAFDGTPDGKQFLLTRFPASDVSLSAEEKVESIGFYGGPPLILSKGATPIVTGDDDCYSDNGRYSIGSMPPVAAAVYFGSGAIFLKSDREIFSNANIGSYQNAEWADLVFQKLASIRQSAPTRDENLQSLRLSVAALNKRQKAWIQERKKIKADLEAAYDTKEELRSELEKSNSLNENLTVELNRISDRLAQYESMQNRQIAAGIAGFMLLLLFLLGLMIGRRRARGRV
jgi:uncharacterized protein YecT (DUF1311 family)